MESICTSSLPFLLCVTAGRDPAACEVAFLLVVVSDSGLEPSCAQFCLFLVQFTKNIPLQ